MLGSKRGVDRWPTRVDLADRRIGLLHDLLNNILIRKGGELFGLNWLRWKVR